MAIHNNPVAVSYNDNELRNLVEEYITQQKAELTLNGVCSYILFWAVEDNMIANTNDLFESNELQQTDQDRVRRILGFIIADGRISATTSGAYLKP